VLHSAQPTALTEDINSSIDPGSMPYMIIKHQTDCENEANESDPKRFRTLYRQSG